MKKFIAFSLLFFAFILARSQSNDIDSIARSILTIPSQMDYSEKMYRPSINDRQNEENNCEETNTNYNTNITFIEKSTNDRITRYKKMIEELRGEKNKLESKGQNTSEIDRKIDKLQTLILNLSK